MEEIWKDIKDYEGLYQVSSLGRVKSLERVVIKNGNKPYRIRERILKQAKNKGGYPFVILYKYGIRKLKPTHQMVAVAFLNHVPGGYERVVNHINHIKDDNRVENLEIVSQRENTNQKHLSKSSKYVGVHKTKYDRWRARIRYNGKQECLGLFRCEKEAAKAYQKRLKEIQTEA